MRYEDTTPPRAPRAAFSRVGVVVLRRRHRVPSRSRSTRDVSRLFERAGFVPLEYDTKNRILYLFKSITPPHGLIPRGIRRTVVDARATVVTAPRATVHVMEKPCIDRDVVARLKSPPSREERATWPSFTMTTLRAHRSLESRGWIVVHERVFDITAFARTHPGFFNAGQVSTAIAVARALGTDATDDFESIHSPRAWTQLADFQIGVLATTNGDEDARGETDDAVEAEGVETPVPRWLSNDRDFWVRYGGGVSSGVRRAVGEDENEGEGEGEARDEDDDDDVKMSIPPSTSTSTPRSSSDVGKTLGRWVARALVAAVARALAARARRKRRGDASSRCALDDGRGDVRPRSRASSEPMD